MIEVDVNKIVKNIANREDAETVDHKFCEFNNALIQALEELYNLDTIVKAGLFDMVIDMREFEE